MRFQLTALRLVAVFAIGICAAILAEYFFSGTFCHFGSGCEAVTSSAYGRVLGVPLPVVGLFGFGLVFGLSLFPERRSLALIRPLALAGALAGVALILVQIFVLERSCTLCLVADGAAIGLAGIALAGDRSRQEIRWPRCLAWLAAAAFAVAIPPLVAWLNFLYPAPDEVRAHWVKGKITLVEVTAFECKQCLAAELTVQAFLKQQADEGVHLNFARIVVPMPQLENSRVAARAYLAARAQGKSEQMAFGLSTAKSLFPIPCRDLAKSIGLDLREYDRVVADPAADAELDANLAWAKSHSQGLPLIWVQQQRINGMPSLNTLQKALRRARPFP